MSGVGTSAVAVINAAVNCLPGPAGDLLYHLQETEMSAIKLWQNSSRILHQDVPTSHLCNQITIGNWRLGHQITDMSVSL